MRINNFKGENKWKAMPQKIDLIDRKIMYLLCKNARFSNTAIGKALNLKREVVSYRIKKMYEKGFLNGFFCRINPRKLGFLTNMIYLKLKTPANEKEMVENLMNLKEVTNLKNCGGKYDIRIDVTTNNLEDFDSTLKKIMNSYHSTIQEYSVLSVLNEEYAGHNLLLDPESLKKLSEVRESKGSCFQKELEYQNKSNEVVRITDLDRKILLLIKMNSRISLKEIAAEIGSNFSSVNLRIKKLVKEGVITKFTSLPAMSLLGYQLYHVLFHLRNADENKLRTFLKQQRHVCWLFKVVGNWNYQVNILAKNNAEFHNVLNDIREEFAENIVSFDTLMVFNSFKMEQRVD